MINLLQCFFRRISLPLLAIITLCGFIPSSANAQSVGPTVNVCSITHTYDNSSGDIEKTVCIYGDTTQISGTIGIEDTNSNWLQNTGAEGMLSDGQDAPTRTPYFDTNNSDGGYYTVSTPWVPTVLNAVYTMSADFYICDNGISSPCYWRWFDSESVSAQVTGPQGYINPKYIVLGVTYAPPGPASSATYTDSVSLGTTNSLANSVSSGTSYSVSVSSSFGILGWKTGTSWGSTNSAAQIAKDTQTTTLNWATTNTLRTSGTPTAIVNGAYTSPVNHDYDTIYVWLNPVEVLTLSSGSVVWNGYGYDANDQNGMEVIPIALGYLNGDFGPMPSNILFSTNRQWAAGQIYASGQSAALDSNDFAAIAQADPFSNSSYGSNDIGYNPPTPNTFDNRFTRSACNNSNSVSFNQANPSQSAPSYTCTLSYSDLNSSAKTYTKSSINTYSLDQSFAGSLFQQNLSIAFKAASTTTTTTEVNNSISQTQSTSATANIVGLPCNNSQPYVGPCVPVYSGPPQLPTEFMLYQDNLYGTFMFAPLYYY